MAARLYPNDARSQKRIGRRVFGGPTRPSRSFVGWSVKLPASTARGAVSAAVWWHQGLLRRPVRPTSSFGVATTLLAVPKAGSRGVVEPDFAALLRFRTALRRFNRWSETQAATVGITQAQHQLLLAVKGHSDARGPRIGEIAEYLLVRQHSVVELASRVEALGFVARHVDETDRRVVRLMLTPSGEDTIRALSALHLRELRTLAPLLQALTDGGPSADGALG